MNATLRTACLLSVVCAPASATPLGGGVNGLTERVLFQAGGAQLSDHAYVSDVSADGHLAVVVTADSLVAEDTNLHNDVYVLDLDTGALQLASANPWGAAGDDGSWAGRISDDGRYVVFATAASNLALFDTNGETDVVRKDLQDGSLELVSTAAGSLVSANDVSEDPDISADGRYVVFRSRASDLAADSPALISSIYRRDMATGKLVRITHGVIGDPNGDSHAPRISDDGTRVAYASSANNLVPFDGNIAADVFVQDVGGAPVLLSMGLLGAPADGPSVTPRISGDGTIVAFGSLATNLVAGDLNGSHDVFWAEVATGTIELVSARPDGASASDHSNISDLSGDGKSVLFVSGATDLTPEGLGTIQLYVRDMLAQTTALVSRPSGATKVPNDNSSLGRLSDDGRTAVFSSAASNLDQGDTNGTRDVFERVFFADPFDYCVTGTTSAGCQPQVASVGLPSASADAGFSITCGSVPKDQIGVFIYSLEGSAVLPVLGGTLCIGPLAGRSPGLFSGGSPTSPECAGSFSLDMNAFAAGALGGTPHAGLSLVGQQVNGQFWGRDPDLPLGFYFSEGIEYVVGP